MKKSEIIITVILFFIVSLWAYDMSGFRTIYQTRHGGQIWIWKKSEGRITGIPWFGHGDFIEMTDIPN